MEHDPFCHSGTIFVAENGYDFSMRLVLVSEYPDRHYLVVFCAESITIADKYVFSGKTLDYLDESIGAFLALDVFPHQDFLRTLHEPDYFRFGFFAIGAWFRDLDFDRIAIEGSIPLTFSDE